VLRSVGVRRGGHPTSSYIEQGRGRRPGSHKGSWLGFEIKTKTLLQILRHFGKEERRGRKKKRMKKRILMAVWPASQLLKIFPHFDSNSNLSPTCPSKRLKKQKQFSFFLLQILLFIFEFFFI
jgi:hypothetical protein